MKTFLKALAFAAFMSTFGVVIAGQALAGWPIDKMNEQIEKTNVVVGSGCSGTIIGKEDRLVLTAYHCITGQLVEEEIKTIDDKTGEVTVKKIQKRMPLTIKTNKVVNYEIVATAEHLVKIVGVDLPNDIALLQVTDVAFVPEMVTRLAPDSFVLLRGLRIYAVGNPAVVWDNSITEGIISSPQRTLNMGGQDHKFFQHSAAVIGGNSGGSLLNDNGELIGTVSAGIPGANIGFAVPISFTKDLLRKSGFARILEVK